MTNEVQKIKEWISKTQDGFMDAQGNFEYPEHEGAYNILCNLDAYIDSLQGEPVSEELEKAAYHNCIDRLSKESIEDFKAGAKWKEQQMMKDATDVTVHVDAGGYPYIPQMELYDYDNDVPLAKEGDKYKVILIKED